ncbi:LuxR family transcriptional regulator [Nonomuraea sp. NEAU-A123]|uniref:helix-turn-helix transcriptional regulator n=1 Tax=Nonomuraea sp. NEAU-A123 TaxID=2839649 RepID=UPI001BE4CA47|nr:LuxR family transcriptional regulator [Nonomuraea sp. NEAU-A123]MBT2230009.1 AAA family ATPase [Nonomuraea sp. NEAU-A123]MBT2230722.1 AAA family ATPase [Nonomuraea sp. NEAU-A123]
MTLIERDHEITDLDDLLRDCIHGKGRVMVITGPTGVGKTELAYTFSQRAAAAGITWLSATCSRTDRTLPLGMASQSFHSAALPIEHASEAARLIEEAAFSAKSIGESPHNPDWLHTVQGLWSIVLELSTSSPVLITVDDVEYSDALSWQLLLNFVQRLNNANVFVVVTATENPQGMDPLIEIDLMRHPHCRHMRLGTLSREGVTKMLCKSMDQETAEKLGPDFHKAGGGNPLLVEALVEDYLHESGESHSLVIGDAFSRSVRALLHRTDPTSLRTARGLAVLGDLAFPNLLAELLELPPATVQQTLNYLAAVGIVDGASFCHPETRSAVLDDLDPEQRKDMHRRAAQLLHTEGAASTAVAEHLIHAADGLEPWAMMELREAADQTLLNDEHEFAIQCLRLAIDLCHDDARRAALRASLARTEWLVNPAATAQHLDPLMAMAREGHLGFEDVRMLLRFFLWHGRLEEAAEALRRLNAMAAESGEKETLFRLGVAHQWLASAFPPLLLDAADTSIDTAKPAAGVWQLQGAALLSGFLRTEEDEHKIATAERVLQSATLDDANLEAVESSIFTLLYSDQADRAAPLCDVLLEEAVQRRSPTWRAVLAGLRAHIAIRQGDLAIAHKYASIALNVLPSRSMGIHIGLPLAALIRTNTEMGKFDVATQLLRHPIPAAIYQSRFGLHYLQARAYFHLATGLSHAALNDFLSCGRLMRAWNLDTPVLAPWRQGAAAALMQMGQPNQARALLEEPYDLPGADSLRAKGATLRLLAGTGDLKKRPALLREAVDMLQSAGDRLEMAYALVDLTHAFNEIGELHKARMIGYWADRVADECQAEPLRWAVRQDDPAEQETEDTESMGLLSDAEQRVASLAALGYTNREISRKIYITVSTVEQHLTRIYRKLNVRGRRDLPAQFSYVELR